MVGVHAWNRWTLLRLAVGCYIPVPVQDAPFFTVKLQVKMLPCLVFFQNGVACDRAVGFDDYGASDDFPTTAVEQRLLKSGECLQLLPECLPDDDHDFINVVQQQSSGLQPK